MLYLLVLAVCYKTCLSESNKSENYVYRITVLGTGANQTSYVNAQDILEQKFDTPARVDNCSGFEQVEVRKCAEPLYNIGAFREEDDEFEFSWQYFLGRSQEYFTSVCESFLMFDFCIDPYKESCFAQEPTRTRYQAAIGILEFICNDGYDEILENFECFSRTLSRAEMMQCQADIIADTRKLPSLNDKNSIGYYAALCGAVRNYVDCIKYPVRYECGYRAWYTLREMLIRPATTYLPDCDIAGRSETPSTWRSLYSIVTGLFTTLSMQLWS